MSNAPLHLRWWVNCSERWGKIIYLSMWRVQSIRRLSKTTARSGWGIDYTPSKVFVFFIVGLERCVQIRWWIFCIFNILIFGGTVTINCFFHLIPPYTSTLVGFKEQYHTYLLHLTVAYGSYLLVEHLLAKHIMSI